MADMKKPAAPAAPLVKPAAFQLGREDILEIQLLAEQLRRAQAELELVRSQQAIQRELLGRKYGVDFLDYSVDVTSCTATLIEVKKR